MSKHHIHGFHLPTELEVVGHQEDYRLLRRLPTIGEIFMTLPADRPVTLGILDTETTGLDPERNELIEIAITMMTINADGSIYQLDQPVSWLQEPSAPLEQRIIEVTGLTDADLVDQRFDEDEIADQISGCHILVSHNAKFDRAFLANRFGDLVDKPWGCTVADMDWLAHGLGGRSLGHLLYEAGYFYEAHRAGPDSWALACLLAGRGGDGRTYAAHLIDTVRQSSSRIYAHGAPYAIKNQLKGRGYRWNPGRRCWWIDVSPSDEFAEQAWLEELSEQVAPVIDLVTAYERHL